MKKLTFVYLAFIFPLLMFVLTSCNTKGSKEESKSIAEDKNDEKFDTKAGEKEAQFVVDLVSSSYTETALAELAEKRSTDQEVKSLASMLKAEHAAMISDLKKIASKRAISIPTEATDKIQEKVKSLSDKKDFDKQWCAEIRDEHKEIIDRFENATTSIEDPDLKIWVDNTLPKIRSHHDKIMACHERLK